MNSLPPEIHLAQHAQRTAELQQAAAQGALTPRRAKSPYRVLRTRVGWQLVELGLRLVTPERRRSGGVAAQGA